MQGRGSDWATPQAKRVLRKALRNLTHGKCAYCESRLDVSTGAEIEHFVAKTLERRRAFDWENLFPACRLCNQSKGDRDHQGMLLKPDVDDPEPYFWLRPNGELAPFGSDERRRRCAEETIATCRLQRGPLCRNRQHVMILMHNPDNWALFLAPEQEYKFVIRHLLRRFGCADLADEDRRRFERTGREP